MTPKTSTTGNTARLDVFDVFALGLLNLLWATLTGVWWLLLFPMFSLPIVLAAVAGLFWGPVAALGVVGVSLAGIMLWRQRRPEMFERWVTRRARTRFLTWFRYRRRWAKLMTACHLSIDRNDRTFIPRLLSADIGRVSHLAHAFGALDCRATITGPGTVELAFRRSDSLADTVILPRVDHWTEGQGRAA
ncbi:hypothetical protein [Nocardia pneumoniae]|uniref:hypothetical protein n=1 Tax=Nocardia pneumoniae TaxID=228601 RepID=UPI00030966E4|nr:hypothetical protein [Nocardia pneumoniae]